MTQSELKSSYTNRQLGIYRRLLELFTLVKHHRTNNHEQVKQHISHMVAARSTIESALGEPLCGKRILEIGPGQLLKQARFFATNNQVIAIDLDEIVIGADLIGLVRTFKTNGSTRFAKTLVRKGLGIDRRFAAEFARQMPTIRTASPQILRRDAASTGFAACSFDCIMSFSVFEHLPDPEVVIQEIVRLLRARGVSHHIVHIYTSDSGAHDARSFHRAAGSTLPYWCHLREDTANLYTSNCYVNKWRMSEWISLFERRWPGAEIRQFRTTNKDAIGALTALRAEGALNSFGDEELLTDALQITWRKPG